MLDPGCSAMVMHNSCILSFTNARPCLPSPHPRRIVGYYAVSKVGQWGTHKSSSSFESAEMDESSLIGTGPDGVAFFSPPEVAIAIPIVERRVPIALRCQLNSTFTQ